VTLTFKDDKHRIKNGDIFCFRGKGLWSWLIRCISQSKVSHIGIAIWLWDRLYVLEAKECIGVRLFPMDMYAETYAGEINWYENLGFEYGIDINQMMDHALCQVGKKYSFTNIFRDFISKFRRVPDKYYCSHLVLECLREAGYGGEGFNDPNPSPGEVATLPCLHRMGTIK